VRQRERQESREKPGNLFFKSKKRVWGGGIKTFTAEISKPANTPTTGTLSPQQSTNSKVTTSQSYLADPQGTRVI